MVNLFLEGLFECERVSVASMDETYKVFPRVHTYGRRSSVAHLLLHEPPTAEADGGPIPRERVTRFFNSLLTA